MDLLISPRTATSSPVAALDDAELCKRSARGDDHAFSELCRRHTPALLSMARALGLSDADASDVVQEALCRVLQKRHFLATVTRVRGWLYRVALNLARSRTRKAARQLALLQARQHDVPVAEAAPIGVDDDAGRHARFTAALDVLSPKQRDVVVLRVGGLSFSEVGKAIGSSENACKVHFHHAVKRLKAELGETP